MSNNKYQEAYLTIVLQERYLKGINYGKPRPGHAEGTIQLHINELTQNLKILNDKGLVPPDDFWKLVLLIHTHDTFKGESHAIREGNVAIENPNSHASLARAFLSEFISDEVLLNIVQYHDLGYALYRNYKQKRKLNEMRLVDGLNKIKDLNLYLLFCIIDSCTASKGREMITWWVDEVNKRFKTNIKRSYITLLPAPTNRAYNEF